MRFHNEKDSFEQLRKDGDGYKVPQSVQDSALAELKRRGFPKEVVEAVRLGKLTPDCEK